MKAKHFATIKDQERKIKTGAVGDTRTNERISEVFRGLDKNAGISVLYLGRGVLL